MCVPQRDISLFVILDFAAENEEGRDRAKKFCDHLWPEWDKLIKEKHLRRKYCIENISKFCSTTEWKL